MNINYLAFVTAAHIQTISSFMLSAFSIQRNAPLHRSRQRLRKKIILNAFVLLNIAVQLLNRIPAAC